MVNLLDNKILIRITAQPNLSNKKEQNEIINESECLSSVVFACDCLQLFIYESKFAAVHPRPTLLGAEHKL